MQTRKLYRTNGTDVRINGDPVALTAPVCLAGRVRLPHNLLQERDAPELYGIRPDSLERA